MTYALIWIAGTVAIWAFTWWSLRFEPTAHGQDELSCLGCALGLLWPLFIAYLIVASPWIAVTWWQTRGER